jgi:hypothetical protein
VEAEFLFDVEIISTDHGDVVGRPGEVKILRGPNGKPYRIDMETLEANYEPADRYTEKELKRILEGL